MLHVCCWMKVMDLECEDKDVGLEELRWIHRHKTGALLKARPRSLSVSDWSLKEIDQPAT